MSHFILYKKEHIASYINAREGEAKLGERIGLLEHEANWQTALANTAAKFVVIGVNEDIGVRANLGVGGAGSAWLPFLKSFLNIQDNRFLDAASVLLLGEISFSEKYSDDIALLREQTSIVDDAVFDIVKNVFAAGKIPVVIGGGHNNAYPILKAMSTVLDKPVNAVNLDAHSDFRIEEGRHSGNGFRYAYNQGFLKRYAMLGLHEAYNSEPVLKELYSDEDLMPLLWEDIFMRNKFNWEAAIQQCLRHVNEHEFGVELDVDSIENVLSSAMTPLGVTPQQAMAYLYAAGLDKNSCYLHLPEAVSNRADGAQSLLSGKMLSYLVQAFIKGVAER